MGKQRTGNLRHCLKPELAISIEGKSKEPLAATVEAFSADKLSLQLARPTSRPPFQEGERVRIKYWNEEVLYCWEAEAVKISGSGNQQLELVMRGEGVTIQRRRPLRVRATITFSFTVIDAAETQLVGKKVLRSKTQNVSGGGLAFETRLPLRVGDKLEMNLHLFKSERVNAVGWVVRSEPVEHDGKHVNSVGVQFLQLEDKEQVQLLKFLRFQMTVSSGN